MLPKLRVILHGVRYGQILYVSFKVCSPSDRRFRDVKTRKAVVMDIKTNSFCATGMHLPNGSYVTFGGNDAVTLDGKAGSQKNPDGTGAWDSIYQDFDGRRAIRILNPCKITDNLRWGACAWYDEPTILSMKKERWYAAAEATGEGEVVIIGGFIRGGFVNRWVPNVDPVTERGQAEPTYEYYPPRSGDLQQFNFLVQTSGLNAYAHTFLMPSGKMLVQANLSTSRFPPILIILQLKLTWQFSGTMTLTMRHLYPLCPRVSFVCILRLVL